MVERAPIVISSSSSKHVALVLDSCLHVFGHNISEGGDVISIDVRSLIDAVCWTVCENFVLLALRSGQGQLVHIPSRVPLPPFFILDEGCSTRASNSKRFAGV